MNRDSAEKVVLVLIFVFLGMATLQASPPTASSQGTLAAYLAHLPILIEGNRFNPSNGVVSGTGTAADPYVIEGWEIDSSSAPGIEIRNSNAHFVIRNSRIDSGGILLHNVTDGRVEGVTLSKNGISLRSSSKTAITGNNISGAGISLSKFRDSTEGNSNILISNNNIVDGTGISLEIAASANVTVSGNSILRSQVSYGVGISVGSSSNVTLSNNSVSFHPTGITVGQSSRITVSGNHITDTLSAISALGDVRITHNEISNNEVGIHAGSGLNVTGNTISNNGQGVVVGGSEDIIVSKNIFTSDGVFINQYFLSRTYTITPDNLVNGKPLYYYKDCTDLTIDGVQVGQLIVVNCNRVRVANLQISNTDTAMQMALVNDTNIVDNNIFLNGSGIDVCCSRNVTISRNNIAWNEWIGILASSLNLGHNFRVHHNNFINNNFVYRSGPMPLSGQVSAIISSAVSSGILSWDAGYPTGGNYWSDYTGTDSCSGPDQNICTSSDGIGDSQNIINQYSKDDYPLVARAETSDINRPVWSIDARLSVLHGSSTSIVLTWSAAQDNVGVAGYRVYKDGTLLTTLTAKVRGHNVTGLTPGTRYTFKIEASDPGGSWTSDGPLLTLTTTAPNLLLDYWYVILPAAAATGVALFLTWIRARKRWIWRKANSVSM